MIEPKALLTAVLLLAGCQSYIDNQGRAHLATGQLLGPGARASGIGSPAYVSNEAVFSGVRSFNEFHRRDGLATLRTMVDGCRKSATRGLSGDLIAQCFAMDVAAFLVTVSHDRVHHTAPVQDMDVNSFRQRFAAYQQALAVPPPLRQQVEDSVFQRVSSVLGSPA